MPAHIRPSVLQRRARIGAPRARGPKATVGALALAGIFGCNALFDIEEATLCEGSACATAEASPGLQSAERRASVDAPGPNSRAPDAGVPDRAAAPGAAAIDAGAAVDAPRACAKPAPDLAGECAACGGSVGCDGRCDVALPPNLGAPCGSCGGLIDCGGGCSVATPSDFGSVLPLDTQASFSCCLIDEVRSYGPDGPDSAGCYPGYAYDGCSVSKVSGLGSVSIVEEDAASCTCRVRVKNTGLDGATYTVHLRLKRDCQPE